VLLVRHGQSEWNATGRWQGREDPPLTDLGLRQAREAAAALGAVDAIHSSPLQRALATAAAIAGELGVGPVVVTEDLVERDAGEWQGLTRAEIEKAWPGYLDDGRRPPGWEPDDLVEGRAFGALGGIAAAHPSADVLAMAHAGVVYAIERSLGAPHERLANLAGRWLELHEGRWRLGPRVHLLLEETVPDQL